MPVPRLTTEACINSTRKLKDGKRTEMAIRKTAGKRLRYEEPMPLTEK